MHDNHVCPLCQNMSLTEVWHAKTRWLMIAIKCPTSAVGGGGGGGGIQEKPTSKEQRNVCLLSSLGWSAAGGACPVRRRSRHVSCFALTSASAYLPPLSFSHNFTSTQSRSPSKCAQLQSTSIPTSITIGLDVPVSAQTAVKLIVSLVRNPIISCMFQPDLNPRSQTLILKQKSQSP